MIISLFLRHFKIYKGINFIPLSEGENFSSIIGENGCGKSSTLEALDFIFNKKAFNDWPINTEARSEGGLSAENAPFILPVFLIKKEKLKKDLKAEQEFYEKAQNLSNFLWNTTYKAKGKFFDDFYKHLQSIKKLYNQNEYFLLMVGKKHNDTGVFFGSFHNQLKFINNEPHKEYEDDELQKYFKGFFDYVIGHYSYIHIPVETDVQTYTKLETQDMQKLMDRNIQKEIENAIKPATLKQINKDLTEFVKEIESVLELYQYKGHYKDKLTMPDLVSKIIEAFFSIKVLNRKQPNSSKSIPVSELSSGEKRKALIDVAYSFLIKNTTRENNIILAIDEPEASLHVANCYDQFDKLFKISRGNHQIIISTHWYGFLPVTANGTATALRKNNKNEITSTFLNLYNFRENIVHSKKLSKGPLPVDYSVKSYNDLVQSIIHSVMKSNCFNWIICEGQSEKIYFEYFFRNEIENNRLRLLPVGGYKEVKKIYGYLRPPLNDPDYDISGKILCLIDTDTERVEVNEFKQDQNLFFKRLLLLNSEVNLVDVTDVKVTPPTEIEDCLDPYVFFQTLREFEQQYPNIKNLLNNREISIDANCSGEFLDLTRKEEKVIKEFFDDNEGYNKLLFAKKYVNIATQKFFESNKELTWIQTVKKKILKF